MMKRTNTDRLGKGLLIIIFSAFILMTFHQSSTGQEKPPRPIKVTVDPLQGLMFGAFAHGASGGTITIYPDGSRSSSGSVIQLSLGYIFSPAVFNVEGIRGTVISITDNSATGFPLSGSNGGTLTLHLGLPQTNTSCGTPFVLNAESPMTMEIRIGGTLTVGNSSANPAGSYSGTFTVIFNQE